MHGLLEAFTTDAATRLRLASADGDEIPFELTESERGGAIPLYCYRPLTGAFIRSHLGLLVALPSYAPAARGLEFASGTSAYLRARGETDLPGSSRERADVALRLFLARVFEERSEFSFDPERFRRAYVELERALYRDMSLTEVLTPLLGLELDPDTTELVLGDGLSLLRPEGLADPPAELWPGLAHGREAPDGMLILILRIATERDREAPVALARLRFRRVLAALRLFERGSYALGPIGFSRIDGGAWAAWTLGGGGRPGPATILRRDHEDELRAFCSLVTRRLQGVGAGEVAWALARFEMACERPQPLEALSDHLLALRALLEPEGTGSGRLAQRLAVICAAGEQRAVLAERIAAAINLERAVMTGTSPASDHPVHALVEEVADHLRAILRDVLCGHLDPDVRAVADELLADAAQPAA